MIIEGIWIHWPEQCQCCSKSWTTEYCDRNQSFMKKLNGMYQEYLGTVEFKCDYFVPDLEKIKENQECGDECAR